VCDLRRRQLSTNATALFASTITALGVTASYYFLTRKKPSRPAGSTKEVAVLDGDRKYLIGGNWKCNGTIAENEALVKVFNEAGPIPSNVEVVVCSSFIHLSTILETLRSDMAIGAQDVGVNPGCGAQTGEVNASQLADLGCTWVIAGHSERREGFGMTGEPNDVCASKCKVAVKAGLNVMFCIGEKAEERENGTTMDVCASQLEPLAKILEADDWAKVAIAYEPVWAIGSGLTATPEMAQETHKSIREWIASNVSEGIAKAIRIQYGGSMKGANAAGLLAQPDIDGGLIGGASLSADFFNIINAVP
jgi:triosephosphate isomerase (TIM)